MTFLTAPASCSRGDEIEFTPDKLENSIIGGKNVDLMQILAI